MFNLFKKRSASPSADNLLLLTDKATNEIRAKWIYFCETLPMKEGTPLSIRMRLFITPIQELIEKSYPILLTAPAELYWTIIFTGILESKTHPSDEINAAIDELSEIYAS